jgi:peptide/nickel transport system substrate-binding protein
MRRGNSFSNGHALTSSDVRFSFERILALNIANGPARLLDALAKDPEAGHQNVAEGAIQTPDESTVVFHLSREDDGFMALLATAAASIVDEELYPTDKLLADDEVVGSGPLALRSFAPGLQATFEANPGYSGTRPAKAAHAYVQYYSDSPTLRSALENGEVDVAWRMLTETDLADLARDPALKVYQGATPSLPAWSGKNAAVAMPAVKGVDETLDATGIFRLWTVSK